MKWEGLRRRFNFWIKQCCCLVSFIKE